MDFEVYKYTIFNDPEQRDLNNQFLVLIVPQVNGIFISQYKQPSIIHIQLNSNNSPFTFLQPELFTIISQKHSIIVFLLFHLINHYTTILSLMHSFQTIFVLVIMNHYQQLTLITVHNILYFAFDQIFINYFYPTSVLIQLTIQPFILHLMFIIIQVELFNSCISQLDNRHCSIGKPNNHISRVNYKHTTYFDLLFTGYRYQFI